MKRTDRAEPAGTLHHAQAAPARQPAGRSSAAGRARPRSGPSARCVRHSLRRREHLTRPHAQERARGSSGGSAAHSTCP